VRLLAVLQAKNPTEIPTRIISMPLILTLLSYNKLFIHPAAANPPRTTAMQAMITAKAAMAVLMSLCGEYPPLDMLCRGAGVTGVCGRTFTDIIAP
jgi:hypothetical protein